MKFFSDPSKRPKLYRLAIEKLEPGDIILTRNDYGLSSSIRFASNMPKDNRYSHAVLYLRQGYAMEATRSGVFGINPMRIIDSNKGDILVLRPGVKITEQQIQLMESWARTMVGVNYANSGAARAGFHKKLGIDIRFLQEDGQFCSKFVAEAYRNAGLVFFEVSDLQTPTSLINKNFYSPSEMVAEHSRVAGIDVESEGDFTIKLFNDLFADIRSALPKSGREVRTFEGVIAYLYKNPGYDSAVSRVFSSSGYCKFIVEDLYEERFGACFSNLFNIFDSGPSGFEPSLRLAYEILRDPDAVFRNEAKNLKTYMEILEYRPESDFAVVMCDFYEKMIESKRSSLAEALYFVCMVTGKESVQHNFPGVRYLEDFDFLGCSKVLELSSYMGIEFEDAASYFEFVGGLGLSQASEDMDSILKASCLVESLSEIKFGEDIWAGGMGYSAIKNMACYSLAYESASLKMTTNKTPALQKLIREIDDLRDRLFVVYLSTSIGIPPYIKTNKGRKMLFGDDLEI